jgi:hypothetical protein
MHGTFFEDGPIALYRAHPQLTAEEGRVPIVRWAISTCAIACGAPTGEPAVDGID